MRNIDHASVIEYLRENEPAGQATIATDLLDTDARCSECGSKTSEYEEAIVETKSVLRELQETGMILSTPEWNWKLTSRGRN